MVRLNSGFVTRRQALARAIGAMVTVGTWSAVDAVAGPVLRVAVGAAGPASIVDPLDPLSLALSSTYGPGPLLASALHSGLVVLTARGTIVPGLARGWRESPDRMEWWFELAGGADVRGVARYLSGVSGPRGRAARTRLGFETSSLVRGWYVRRGRFLAVRLRHPVSAFPRLLAGTVYRVPELASGVAGPFSLQAVESAGAGTLYRLRTSPDRAGVVQMSGLELVVVADPEERLTHVRTGDVDYAVGVEGAVTASAGLRGVIAHVHACERVPMILARIGGYPASDPGAVGALKAVFDASALLRDGFSGRGAVAPGAPLPESFHGLLGPLVCLPSASAAADVLRAGGPRIGTLRVADPGFVRLARSCIGQLRSAAGLDLAFDASSAGRPGIRLGGLEIVPLELGLDPRVVFRYLLSPAHSGVRWETRDLHKLARHTFLADTASVRTDRMRRMATDFACRASAVVPVMPHRVDVSSVQVRLPLRRRSRPVRFSADAFLSGVAFD